MMLDGHIHINNINVNRALFKERLEKAEVEGGLIISYMPNSFDFNGVRFTTEQRLENLLSVAKDEINLYPFYWIDPMEEDALDQVKLAAGSGVAGFKVICNKFYPGDSRPMEVFREIAKFKRPLLFHSGILWDGQPSSRYNRPGEFEALLEIEGLKFSLAHISWPWVDECIAVYGKLLHAYNLRGKAVAEMYIDVTPGTPAIYREEALKKLFTVGYDVENNVIFGSDCSMENYNTEWTREWVKRDRQIYAKLGVDAEVQNKIFSENLKRFVGISEDNVIRKTVKVAE